MPTGQQSITLALRELVRPGATGIDLTGSPLLDLPVVLQRAAATRGARSLVFLEMLERICSQRLQGKDREIAPVVFGLGQYAGRAISDRYHTAAQLYHEHWSWESFRKEPLSRLLSTVALALMNEGDLAPVPIGPAISSPLTGLVGHDWVMEYFDAVYRLPDHSGDQLEVMQTRRLRALRDGAKQWRNEAKWRERGVSGYGEVSLFGPGSIQIIDSHAENGAILFVQEVTFNRPYRAGEIVEFSLVRRMPVDLAQYIPANGCDWYGLLKLPAPVAEARIRLQFGKHRPAVVWRHEAIIDGLVRVGEPVADKLIQIDANGTVAHTWRDLSSGMSYGLALKWVA